MKTSRFKIILLGDGRVGKTSLLKKYVNNTFDENEEKTTNYSYLEKLITHNNQNYKFCIWDTAGQEQFNSLTPIYYRDAKGVLLVYDILNQKSFTRVQKWTEELHSYNNEALLVIIGNKSDLVEENKDGYVNKEDANDLAIRESTKLFYTSAKTGDNVNESFEYIIHRVIEKHELQTKEIKKEGKFLVGGSDDEANNDENKSGGYCC